MKGNVFTMIPANSDEFYAKNEGLNLLHLYITERVRGFDKCGKTCYISNEQLAKETNSSISTIKRAVKLLVDLKILWAGYHQESVKNKQRVLRIYNEEIGAYNDGVQNDTQRGSICTSERFNLTPSEVQNEPLVYKENIKSISLEEGSLRTSSRSVLRAEPSATLETENEINLSGVMKPHSKAWAKSKNTRRGLASIEADYSQFEDSANECASLDWLNNNTTDDDWEI